MAGLRNLLAHGRVWLARKGLTILPHTGRASGNYAGFSVMWGDRGETAVLRGAIAHVAGPTGPALMFVRDERDSIQREHLAGRFYEPEELAIIARHFTGGTYVDVGANVGNHAVYAGLALLAHRLVLIEPNPAAATLLEINLRLNALTEIATLHRIALSDAPGQARMVSPVNNLGGTRLAQGEAGHGPTVPLQTGDALLADTTPAFMKIDVEGHEFAVLRGLERTLRRHAPVLFVELEDVRRAEVDGWLEDRGYRKAESFVRYPGLTNQLYLPIGRPAAEG